MKKPSLTSLLLAAVLVTAAQSAYADIAVVVSAKSPVGNLTSDQVSQIFLGKATSFPGGGPAIPVDQAEGSAPREEFYSKITGKSASQVKAYWSKLIFTGKGQPPKEVANSAEVKKQLGSNPAAIGYIEKSAVDASVKVVLSE